MLIICHDLILKSYSNIYHLILLCDFVIVNIAKVLKLEGWNYYTLSILSIGNIGEHYSTWVKDKLTVNIIGYSPYEKTAKRIF